MQRQKRERFLAGTAKICITPREEDITEFHLLSCQADEDAEEPPDALALEADYVADRIAGEP